MFRSRNRLFAVLWIKTIWIRLQDFANPDPSCTFLWKALRQLKYLKNLNKKHFFMYHCTIVQYSTFLILWWIFSAKSKYRIRIQQIHSSADGSAKPSKWIYSTRSRGQASLILSTHKISVVDPDGFGTFAWIRNYSSGSGSSKKWKSM